MHAILLTILFDLLKYIASSTDIYAGNPPNTVLLKVIKNELYKEKLN